MNRKNLFIRDEVISWLKQLKNELDEQDTILLVEGKKDKAIFVNLGIKEKKIITISHLSEEKLLHSLKKKYEGEILVCIPLIDYDSEGFKYLKKLDNVTNVERSRNQFFKKIKIDRYFRKKLSYLTMGRYREIEDLHYFFEELQISSINIK